jgi:hypothetical protein
VISGFSHSFMVVSFGEPQDRFGEPTDKIMGYGDEGCMTCP